MIGFWMVHVPSFGGIGDYVVMMIQLAIIIFVVSLANHNSGWRWNDAPV